MRLLGWIALISGLICTGLATIADVYVVRTHHWFYGYQYSYPYKALALPLMIIALAFLLTSAAFFASNYKQERQPERFCPFCGVNLSIDHKYCHHCGKKLP